MQLEHLINKVDIHFLTLNHFLEKGLVSAIDGCPELRRKVVFRNTGQDISKGERRLTLTLIDTDCILSAGYSREAVSEAISVSDSYSFMSFSREKEYGMPCLSLETGVIKIQHDLRNIIRYGMSNQYSMNKRTLLLRLTEREKEVVSLLGYGFNLREIHQMTEVSQKTVYAIKGNIMRKLGLRHVTELYEMLKMCDFADYHEQRVSVISGRGVRSLQEVCVVRD